MRRTAAALLLCSFALQRMFCTPADSPLAGGSEGGNARVLGAAMYADGMPVANAIVQLRSADYLFGDTALQGVGGNVRTNAQGEFAFDSIVAGEYRIAIYSSEGIGAFVECRVPSGASEITLESALLDSLSSLTGVVDGPGIVGRECRIRPYGLDKKARFESATGRYFLDSMPYGRFALNVRGPSERYGSGDLEEIEIGPGEQKLAPPVRIEPIVKDTLANWGHRKRIVLNTTKAGAPVSQRLVGFPLLVRLRDTDFDFSSAAPKGDDVRFANANGARLPFAIESWDAAGALLWVRVDTIYPASDTQFVTMHWGNEEAMPLSDEARVFDTSSGYVGVWHLAQTADPDYFPDATFFRNNAERHSTDRDTVVPTEGVIGKGLVFPRNYFAYLSAPDAPSLRVQTFTFAAWFRRLPNSSALFPTITAKQNWSEGKGYIFGFVYHDSLSMVTRFLSGSSSNDYSTSYEDSASEEWVHVTGSYDGTTIKMYRNGALVASEDVGAVEILHDATPVQLGRAFKGALDQVSIAREARSADWIRLMYENQRTNQKLMTFQ